MDTATNGQGGGLGGFEADLRRKLALSIDMGPPPPVPPKDPPRPGTGMNSRPSTANTSRPGTAATTRTMATPSPMMGRPTIGGTMSSSRPGTAQTRPGTAGTTATEKLRPGTAVTVKTQPFSPTIKEEREDGEAPTTTGRSWASIASKMTMTPLRPVKISNPMRGFGRSLSLKRSNTLETTTTSTIRGWRGRGRRSEDSDDMDLDVEKRPPTASTRRFSRSTTMTGKTIKYGVGRHAATELSPQPSDDENDPLNWPVWKKDLNFLALLVTAALCNAMKTALIPVAGPLAAQLRATQVEIASLTAMPLILASLASMASLTAAKLYGKRPVYLFSAVLLFIGSVWNTRAPTLAQAAGARLFQGLGWGAFDVLLLGSIHDSYFEHERRFRVAAHDVLCAASMWAPPIFGGVAARNSAGRGGVALHFEVLACFWAVAVPLLVFAAPETAYDRWFSGSSGLPLATPASIRMRRASIGRFEVSVPTMAGVRSWVQRFSPVSEFRGFTDSRTLLQGPRAFMAPTTVLLGSLTFLPVGALWGLAHVLSPLFSPRLDAAQVGSIMAATLTLTVVTTGLFILWSRCRTEADMPNRMLVVFLATGAMLCFIGILAFGIEVHAFRRGGASFPLLSILLGFVAAGSYLLVSLTRPVIWRSARFTGSNLHVCLRNVADMDAGVRCWRGFFTGVFVLAFASAMERSASLTEFVLVPGTGGIRAGCIAVAVLQLVIAGALGAVWWFMDERVRRLDGRVMGFVDLSMLKRSDSFFDHN